jgi:hypothetical protein
MVRASEIIQKYALVELVEEVVQDIIDKNTTKEQLYSIVIGK